MKQADIFMASEGDAWLVRNPHLGERDPVCEAIVDLGLEPKRVLEVGCANGWRLAALREKFGCTVCGVEPSRRAATEAAAARVRVYQGTADSLTVATLTFDLVIYGFCLYLSEPDDWFKIAIEGDRVLQDGGHLVVYDFADPLVPFARKYEHRDGILSYHMRFSQLWLAHPWYRLVYREVDAAGNQVTVLRKDTNAFLVLA